MPCIWRPTCGERVPFSRAAVKGCWPLLSKGIHSKPSQPVTWERFLKKWWFSTLASYVVRSICLKLVKSEFDGNVHFCQVLVPEVRHRQKELKGQMDHLCVHFGINYLVMITSFRYASLRPYIETWRIRFSQKQDSIKQHFYLIFTLSPPTTRGQLQSKTSLYPRAEPLSPAVPVKKSIVIVVLLMSDENL